MAHPYEKELAIAKEIARKSGVIIKKYFFADDQQIQRKEDDSPVTIADTEVNRMVIEELQKEFDDGIIGEEESTAEYGMGRKWICDPIDGTKGFIWGVPMSVFSLALVIDGAPVMGVVYDPFLDLLYEGVTGRRSTCNGKELRVSAQTLAGGQVAMTSGIEKVLEAAGLIKKLLEEKARVGALTGGIYKTCLVARGKFVGYIGGDLGAHDTAAAQLIVEGAGGKVTGLEGEQLDYTKPFNGVVVSNGVVHDRLIELINT